MSEVILSLDTCVFSDKSFISWATNESRVRMNVSPVVYMERLRQLKDNPSGKESLDGLLKRAGIKVSNFEKNSAEIAAGFMIGQPKTCPTCQKLDWNDAIILAGTYRPSSILVTDNIKDFRQFTDEYDKIITPAEAMERFSFWS